MIDNDNSSGESNGTDPQDDVDLRPCDVVPRLPVMPNNWAGHPAAPAQELAHWPQMTTLIQYHEDAVLKSLNACVTSYVRGSCHWLWQCYRKQVGEAARCCVWRERRETTARKGWFHRFLSFHYHPNSRKRLLLFGSSFLTTEEFLLQFTWSVRDNWQHTRILWNRWLKLT